MIDKVIGKCGVILNSQEYFIYLLRCHLSGENPNGVENTDWAEIYSLSEKHSVTAIISSEIKKLPVQFRPGGKLLSAFNQRLGYTVRNYEIKMQAITRFVSVLSDAEIPHLIVKGAVLRFLYPVPELRTSGDTDAIIAHANYQKAMDALVQNGFKIIKKYHNVANMVYNGEEFELHTELESVNVQSKVYFSDFFGSISESSGFTYKLKPFYHLLYAITHIAKHLKTGGAGVRMIMDIDVFFRNYPDTDIEKLLHECENMGLKQTALVLIALSKKWFGTPVSVPYTFDDAEHAELYTVLADVVLTGGVFGFDNGGVGMVNLRNEMGSSGKNGKAVSIKAFFKWVFPGVEYLKERFYYCYKYPVLAPVAWLQRLFEAIFGHSKHTGNAVKQMFSSAETAEKFNYLLKELNITENDKNKQS